VFHTRKRTTQLRRLGILCSVPYIAKYGWVHFSIE
jgi:hypothetical protein